MGWRKTKASPLYRAWLQQEPLLFTHVYYTAPKTTTKWAGGRLRHSRSNERGCNELRQEIVGYARVEVISLDKHPFRAREYIMVEKL